MGTIKERNGMDLTEAEDTKNMWQEYTESESESHSVMSDSFRLHGLYSPWNSPTRILEWVAFPFSGASSQPRDWTQVSHIGGGFFTSWATREAQEY